MVHAANRADGNHAMRVSVILTLITLVILGTAVRGGAQQFAVTGDTVALLAKAVVTEADANFRIPASYNIPLGENGATSTATITLSGVCEIFARTLTVWGTIGGPFPRHISGLTFTWRPPAQPHPELEPPAEQHARIPIMAQYTQFAAEGNVRMAETDPALTMPFSWTQQNKEKLTTAQLIVAMAALIGKRLDGTLKLNDAYTIARVSSPDNWEDISAPYSLLATAPRVTPITLRVSFNGVYASLVRDASNDTADPFPQPFCDTISLHIDAAGPLKRVLVLLDGKLLATFDGKGGFDKSIDTLNYTDARHILTATALPTSAAGKPITMTIPFRILNGRRSDFTPAEGTK